MHFILYKKLKRYLLAHVFEHVFKERANTSIQTEIVDWTWLTDQWPQISGGGRCLLFRWFGCFTLI